MFCNVYCIWYPVVSEWDMNFVLWFKAWVVGILDYVLAPSIFWKISPLAPQHDLREGGDREEFCQLRIFHNVHLRDVSLAFDVWENLASLSINPNIWLSLTLTTLRGMFFVAVCNLSSWELKLTQAGHLTISLHLNLKAWQCCRLVQTTVQRTRPRHWDTCAGSWGDGKILIMAKKWQDNVFH